MAYGPIHKVGDLLFDYGNLGVIRKVNKNLDLYPYRTTYYIDWIDSNIPVDTMEYNQESIDRWRMQYERRMMQDGTTTKV